MEYIAHTAAVELGADTSSVEFIVKLDDSDFKLIEINKIPCLPRKVLT
jgi:D-alanine-D-alanine ligase-like ATP-grasp enzyme